MISRLLLAIKGGRSRIPDEVASVIEAARMTLRSFDDEEGPRVAVALGGPLRGMFIFSREAAEERIRGRWPWLNDAQLKAAVAYLEARVIRSVSPADKPGRTSSVMAFFDRLDNRRHI